MRNLLILVGFLVIVNLTNAQNMQTPKPAGLSPGTMRVRVNVISADKEKARVCILEVLESGQGLTNPLSIGDTIAIGIRSKPFTQKSNEVVVDVKEKLLLDASKSEFFLLDVKKNK